MKTLTAIAKDNNIKYNHLRDKLDQLYIIYKSRIKYIPTNKAIQQGIASESGRFDNEMMLSISYQYDKEQVVECYQNAVSRINDTELPF